MRKFIIISFTIFLGLVVSTTISPPYSCYDWNMLQNNDYRTGSSNLTGEIVTPGILWATSVDDNEISYPLISNQMIYLSGYQTHILDGETGNINANIPLGGFHSLGNLDGNQNPELLISSTYGNNLNAYSGDNNSLMWSVEPGGFDGCEYGIPIFLDVEDDGWPEILILKSVGTKQNGTLYLINGTDGGVIWNMSMPNIVRFSENKYPSEVPAIGDVDGDGKIEVIIADDMSIVVVDALTGVMKWYRIGDFCPPSLSDMDGDGVLDIITANSWIVDDELVHGIEVLDGNYGSVLMRTKLTGLVKATPSIGNIIGDENPEIIVGDSEGYIYAINGEDGNIIWQHYGYYAIEEPAIITDINGDSQNDVIISSGASLLMLNGLNGTLINVISCNGDIGPLAFGDINNDSLGELVFATTNYKNGTIYALGIGEYPVPLKSMGGLISFEEIYGPVSSTVWKENGSQFILNYSDNCQMTILGSVLNQNLLAGDIDAGARGVHMDIETDIGYIQTPNLIIEYPKGLFYSNWTIGNLTQNTTAHISVHAWKEGYQDSWWNVTVNIVGDFPSDIGEQEQDKIPGFGIDFILIALIISLVIIKTKRQNR